MADPTPSLPNLRREPTPPTTSGGTGDPASHRGPIRAVATAALLLALVVAAIVVPAAVPAAVAPPEAGAASPSDPAAAEVPTGPPSEAQRHPAALAAEQAFFASFVHHGPSAAEVVAPLLGAYASDPDDPRTHLLLGANYLRMAARGGNGDPTALEHLVLAERFLDRAAELAPDDHRIASFLVPVRLALAEVEGRDERHRDLVGDLMAAYEADPAFNSFSVAMLGYQSPRGSAMFERGLAALRRVEAMDCEGEDPTCGNGPRWPHAVEGYLSFFADYELKAGEPERARHLLDEMRSRPSYESWPYRELAEARLASFDEHAERLADTDPDNDPGTVVLQRGCAACHRAG